MEKRSNDGRNSERVEVVRDVPVITPKADTPKTVRLVLQKNYKPLIVQGSVTGNIYKFYGAGFVLEVDERDAPVLLQKGTNQVSCCGGANAYPYFAMLEV